VVHELGEDDVCRSGLLPIARHDEDGARWEALCRVVAEVGGPSIHAPVLLVRF